MCTGGEGGSLSWMKTRGARRGTAIKVRREADSIKHGTHGEQAYEKTMCLPCFATGALCDQQGGLFYFILGGPVFLGCDVHVRTVGPRE